MQTIRTLANISYNTDEFFKQKILSAVKNGVIEWCYWIRHKAEDDELKDHIHFTFKPAKRLDTAKFREYLYELDLKNPLPLTCTSKFEPNNSMDDWLLYAVHDIPYLKSKGQWRRHHYKFEDIQATDFDALREDWRSVDRSKYLVLQWLEEAVHKGVPFFRLVQDGVVPIAQRSQYEFQYKAISQAVENERRNTTGRVRSHEEVPQFDEDGVLISPDKTVEI